MKSKSPEETAKLAHVFAKELITKGASKAALVVGLYGDLGAGKTTFTKAFAKSLGVDETVSSPTFVIEKVYDIDNLPWKKFIHIDAYRLKSGDELNKLGFGNALKDPENLILIEWSERVADILPSHIRLVFAHTSETEREIVITYS